VAQAFKNFMSRLTISTHWVAISKLSASYQPYGNREFWI